MTSASFRDLLQHGLEHSAAAGAELGSLHLSAPLGEPIDGVERLHDLAADHPLASAVATAI